jgi:acyl carrier protein
LAQAVGLDINSEDFTKEDMESLLSHAFDRYFETSSLFGTPNTCLKTIDRLKTIGVDEIACLIDFGVDFDLVMSSLKYLDVVQKRSNKKVSTSGNQDYSLPTQIKKHNISHMQCTPSLLRTLTTNPDALDALRSLQKLMLGGEVLPVSLAEELHQLVSGEVLNMYGPTETTIWSTSYLVNGSEKTIPIGKPIANTEIYILDRHYQPVPIGVPGELFIGGRGVVRGYLNRPELTSERFVLNPFSQKLDNRLYATGDLARYSSDGNIEYLGRLDYQVKIRGFRIELGEIEAVLNTHPQIRQSVVIAREDIPGDKRLIAYVVSSDDTLSTKQLWEFLKLKLPEYMVPSFFVTLDTLPLTANGKIDRLGLPIPDGEKRSNLQYISPRNSTEEIIADIFASVLSTQKVSIYDNFFELGGHSLLAIQVISRVKQAFAVEIPLRNMFEEPTIASLSKIIENSNSPLLQQLQTTSYKLGNREEIEL